MKGNESAYINQVGLAVVFNAEDETMCQTLHMIWDDVRSVFVQTAYIEQHNVSS